MLWAIHCIDVENSGPIRDKVLTEHREYLASKKDTIILAGATQSDDGKTATGSMFIVKCNSRAEAEAFNKGDPFHGAGVFKSITITRMRKGQWNPDSCPES